MYDVHRLLITTMKSGCVCSAVFFCCSHTFRTSDIPIGWEWQTFTETWMSAFFSLYLKVWLWNFFYCVDFKSRCHDSTLRCHLDEWEPSWTTSVIESALVFVSVKAEYSNCVNKLEKDLVGNCQSQFEALFKAEAPTWETHGNLMVMTRMSVFRC